MDQETRNRLELLLGARSLTDARRLGGQHGVEHYRLTLADGRMAFAKVAGRDVDQVKAGLAAEAAGLRWIADAETVRVPRVLACDDSCLVIEWVDDRAADRTAATAFGGELARLHAAGASRFGAPWPGVIAGLPLPNDQADTWPDWYASQRLLPYARLARDAGSFTAADVRLVESVASRIGVLAGPAEPPSRIHGDCWAGNVLWSGGRGWLIDPAAHGGHRETDLAMLALFGTPHLEQILTGYQQVAPLADGSRRRVPLHQLHPLLVHVCLFGEGYRQSVLDAASAALAMA